ncbi:MAG: hypothetical protein ACE37K_13770 [Planctomycetota bacterium]
MALILWATSRSQGDARASSVGAASHDAGGMERSGSLQGDPETLVRVEAQPAEAQSVEGVRKPAFRIRFVDPDERPVGDVRLFRPGERVCVSGPCAIDLVSDENGWVELAEKQVGDELVAFHPMYAPAQLRVETDGPAEQVVLLGSGRRLELHCVDDAGAPLGGCPIELSLDQAGCRDGWDWSESGFDNPWLTTSCYRATTDERGVAVIGGIPTGAEAFVRAMWRLGMHDGYFVEVAPNVAVVQIVMHPAWGVWAVVPGGVEVAAWRFHPDRLPVDRQVYRRAKDLASQWSTRAPGSRAYVVASLGEHTGDTVRVMATAVSGELYQGSIEVRPIAGWSRPHLLRRASGSVGWLRVDLMAGLDVVHDHPLILLDQAGRSWSITSGRQVELPVGEYTLTSRVMCPEVMDEVEGVRVHVRDGDRGQAAIALVSLKGPLGWLRIPSFDADVGVTVELESGDGFTLAAASGKQLWPMPLGRHQLRISKHGWAAVQKEVTIEEGQVTDVDAGPLVRSRLPR